MSRVKLIKLFSGEEIVGIIETPIYDDEEGDESYEFHELLFIKNPMKVVYDYGTTNVPSVLLMDWMPASCESIFPIGKRSIVTIVDVIDAIEDTYLNIILTRLEKDGESFSSYDEYEQELENKLMYRLLEEFESDEDDIQ